MYCKNCGTKLPENAIFCSVCGEPVDNAAPLPADPATLPQNTYPMKWHKFLIYFQLFAAALVSLYNAVVCFRMVFLGLGTFGPWNVIYAIAGVICVVLAVWAIYVRFRLAGFRRNGPKMYLLFLSGAKPTDFLRQRSEYGQFGHRQRPDLRSDADTEQHLLQKARRPVCQLKNTKIAGQFGLRFFCT